jgi:subfamily B ATP-binding cassette protein MsbA
MRALRQRPLLGSIFLLTTLTQGVLQGLLVWALREVLIQFGKSSQVSAMALAVGGLVIFAIWVGRAAAALVGEEVTARLAHGTEVETMTNILAKLLSLSTKFFDKHSEGDLVMATYSDVQFFRQITIQFGNILLHLTRLIGVVVVAFVISPKLALLGLVTVPLGAVPALKVGQRIQASSRSARGSVRKLYDSFLQVSAGIRIIKVNTGELRVLARAQTIAQELFAYLIMQVKARSLARFLLESVSGIGLIVVLVVGGRDVAVGALEWQSLLSLLIAIMALYPPTVGILQVYAGIQSSIPHLDRIDQIMDTVPDIVDTPGARVLREAPQTIELRDVAFGYDDRRVLEGISATFHKGETIGIVGPSGAGKSTLISLLLRLYDTTAGSVLLDGVDIRNVRQRDYLNLCAIVMQEPFLFVDTVANNIRAARPDATMEEVIEAAKAANIHEEIMAMENGYETVLGRAELARGVSTGQKQRICIAAALLKNAPLLFLDEATSNLDSVSERHLQVAIDRLMQGRTTFVIAHRLSTLRSADRILVIDEGTMVGLGKHEELLATCSTYRRLWQFQSMARDDRQAHIALSEHDVAVETLTPSAAAK